ncbi:hypothetical protein [Hymenobacter jeollabukensis]|nr:hypothetical protein [Hymenobacter jeollabukensis]
MSVVRKEGAVDGIYVPTLARRAKVAEAVMPFSSHATERIQVLY